MLAMPPLSLKDVLIEKLAEAILTPLPVFTPRQIRGGDCPAGKGHRGSGNAPGRKNHIFAAVAAG